MDWESARQLLNKVTGGRPLVAAGITGGLGALAGSTLGPAIGSLLFRPKTRREYNRMKNRMTLLGAGLGIAPWLLPIGQNISEKGLEGLWAPYGQLSKQSSLENAREFVKSGEDELMDITDAQYYVDRDPVLPRPAKTRVKEIFEKGRQRAPKGRKLQGLLSTSDLIRGAVGAGLGYSAASVAGPFLKGLFGLPAGSKRKLSRTGGIGGALLGSGIINT